MSIVSKWIWAEAMECMWYGMLPCSYFADANSICGCLMCILEWLTLYGISNLWMSVGGK
jgi:hypothetical protein